MPVLDRRRLLNRCAWVAAGVAGGVILPSWFARGKWALAQDNAAPSAEAQLRVLKLVLPVKTDRFPPYVPTSRVDNMLYVSGFEPKKPDGTPLTGKLGQD